MACAGSRRRSRLPLRGRAASMANGDTVWGRLTRFNTPQRGRGRRRHDTARYLDAAAAAWRGLAPLFAAALAGMIALGRFLIVVGLLLWAGMTALGRVLMPIGLELGN